MVLLLSLMSSAAPPASASYQIKQDPASVQKILDAAVEEGVSQVSWAFRSVARPRLAQVATACPEYRVSLQGDQYSVQCTGKDPFTWTVGKSGPWVNKDGKTLTVSLTRTGDALRLSFSEADGGKTWIYDFAGDATLRVTQSVSSGYLAKPMTWTLDYRQTSP